MTAQKPIIYFDIDNTLIDTSALVSSIAIRLVGRGLAAQEFESAVADYYQNLEDTTNFDPQELITLLSERSSIVSSIIEKEFFNPRRFIDALFPDVQNTLATLSQTYVLGVFSQGNLSWQSQKLSLSGIDEYFDPTLRIIASRKLSLESIGLLRKGSAVIDDKHMVITTLAGQRPDLQLFWLNRPAEAPLDALPQSFTEIKAISEVIEKLT